MSMPNFLIIGVGKSGTNSLYYYLKEHPEVYMCPFKEPNFFVYDETNVRSNGPWKRSDARVHAKTFQEYLQLYENAGNAKAIGEASVSNFTRYACDRIRHYLPHARLIAIFRHPVDRAYAQFMHRCREGFEPLKTFLTAYRASHWRKENNWATHFCYQNDAYVPMLEYWLSCFPRDRFRFYLTDDLKSDALKVMKDIFRFLEVDDDFTPDVSKRYNVGYTVRNRTLSRLLLPNISKDHPARVVARIVFPRKLRTSLKGHLPDWNRIPIPPLDPAIRSQLTNELQPNILILQDMIGRDLSHWLS